MITVETATVYRGGRRRYLTLEAAAREEARAAYRKRARANGEPFDYEWLGPRVQRLARLIAFRARLELGRRIVARKAADRKATP